VPIFSPGLHGELATTGPDHHYPPRHVEHGHHHIAYEGNPDDQLPEAVIEEETVAIEEDDEEEFNPFLFIKTLPLYHTVGISGKICLPPLKAPGKLTLALDLDETLVHCTVDPVPNPDHVFSVVFNDTSYQVYVRKRPYLDYFLEFASKTFEVCRLLCAV
jgi:hypothetical protein